MNRSYRQHSEHYDPYDPHVHDKLEDRARCMDASIEEIQLEHQRLSAQIRIDKKAIRGRMEEDFAKDLVRDQVVAMFHHAIFVKDYPKTHIVRYPADWWQAVKDRFAPAWFRDRYPVKFVTIEASAKMLYPDIEPIPRQRGVLKFAVARNIETPIW